MLSSHSRLLATLALVSYLCGTVLSNPIAAALDTVTVTQSLTVQQTGACSISPSSSLSKRSSLTGTVPYKKQMNDTIMDHLVMGEDGYNYDEFCNSEYFEYNDANLEHSQAIQWYKEWSKNASMAPGHEEETSLFGREWGERTYTCGNECGGCSAMPTCEDILRHQNGNMSLARKVLFVTIMQNDIFSKLHSLDDKLSTVAKNVQENVWTVMSNFTRKSEKRTIIHPHPAPDHRQINECDLYKFAVKALRSVENSDRTTPAYPRKTNGPWLTALIRIQQGGVLDTNDEKAREAKSKGKRYTWDSEQCSGIAGTFKNQTYRKEDALKEAVAEIFENLKKNNKIALEEINNGLPMKNNTAGTVLSAMMDNHRYNSVDAVRQNWKDLENDLTAQFFKNMIFQLWRDQHSYIKCQKFRDEYSFENTTEVLRRVEGLMTTDLEENEKLRNVRFLLEDDKICQAECLTEGGGAGERALYGADLLTGGTKFFPFNTTTLLTEAFYNRPTGQIHNTHEAEWDASEDFQLPVSVSGYNRITNVKAQSWSDSFGMNPSKAWEHWLNPLAFMSRIFYGTFQQINLIVTMADYLSRRADDDAHQDLFFPASSGDWRSNEHDSFLRSMKLNHTNKRFEVLWTKSMPHRMIDIIERPLDLQLAMCAINMTFAPANDWNFVKNWFWLPIPSWNPGPHDYKAFGYKSHPQCPKLWELSSQITDPWDANYLFCKAPEWFDLAHHPGLQRNDNTQDLDRCERFLISRIIRKSEDKDMGPVKKEFLQSGLRLPMKESIPMLYDLGLPEREYENYIRATAEKLQRKLYKDGTHKVAEAVANTNVTDIINRYTPLLNMTGRDRLRNEMAGLRNLLNNESWALTSLGPFIRGSTGGNAMV